ncbi:hypothetical protein F5Y02DRAFT_405875 [Annulohypoxylon stygium]|nr:hypothetical protein F5Y02DRAFT_405875 [Annulohypoxylon stygium]
MYRKTNIETPLLSRLLFIFSSLMFSLRRPALVRGFTYVGHSSSPFKTLGPISSNHFSPAFCASLPRFTLVFR